MAKTPTKPVPPQTPECDKWAAVHDRYQGLVELEEFMQSKGWQIAEYPMITHRYVYEPIPPGLSVGDRIFYERKIVGTEEIPEAERERSRHMCAVPSGMLRIAYAMYGIDENALEKERRALLTYEREMREYEEAISKTAPPKK
jgi:hypothetical protein